MSPSGSIGRPVKSKGRIKTERLVISVIEARLVFPPILDHYISLADSTGVPVDSLFLLFPARTQRAFLVESALRLGRTTAALRLEVAGKDELFPPADLRHSQLFTIGKLHAGIDLDVLEIRGVAGGLGIAGALHVVPRELEADYGRFPRTLHVFSRWRVGR